ncbi:MAG: polyprenyl synthetase family protein [Bacteroidota bacterium]
MTDSASLRQLIDAHFQSLRLGEKQPQKLYQPMEYILSLKAKRMRPILTLLSYQVVSGRSFQEAMDLATAIELFHNFTLMHDDIMDSAPVRRGKASVHTVWDENVAILSGDALFAYSIGLVGKGFPGLAFQLTQEFSNVSLLVCEGQQEDMDLADKEEVCIEDYLEMIRKKTATLLGACMSMGAMAAKAEMSLVEKFREFGEAMGLAFQLQDDLMDAFPPQNFGKQIGGDILERKKTYLYLKALELADPSSKDMLISLYREPGGTDGKVEEVLTIFRNLDVKQHTEKLIQHYFESARTIGTQIAEQVDFNPIKTYLQEISKRKW